MTISTERSLTILARMVGSAYGVEVVFGDFPTACTDGNRVMINQEWSTGSQEDATILECIIEHEVGGHALHTDFQAKRELLKHDMPALALNVYGVLEDLRIETAAARRAPGVARILADGVEALVKRGIFHAPDPSLPISPATALCNAALSRGRAELLSGQDVPLAKSAALWNAEAVKQFGPLWDQVWKVIAKAPAAQSTQDVCKLTQDIIAILKNEMPEEPEQPSPGDQKSQKGESSQAGPSGQGGEGSQGGGGSESDQSDGQDASSGGQPGEQSGEDGQDGDQGGDQAADSGKNAKGDKPGKSGKAGQESGDDQDKSDAAGGPKPTQAQLDAAQKALSEGEGTLPDTDLGDLASKAMNESKTVGNDQGRQPGTGAGYNAKPRLLKAEKKPVPKIVDTAARQYNNTITRELEMLLEATDIVDKRIGLNGRFLASNRLPRVALRDARIFGSKRRTEAVSTSVLLLTDISGSTQHSRFTDDGSTYETAGLALLVCFGRLLEKFDIPYSSYVYASDVVKHKDFDATWRKAEESFLFSAGSGTSTGAAMNHAIPELAMQDTERKIMVVITDGDSGDMTLVKAAYNEARENGIETATIFLGNGSHTASFLKSRKMPITSTLRHDQVQNTAVTALSQSFF